jgi:hypothetical protein
VNLNPNAKYTATIKGGSSGVKNAAGNPLASDKVWSFTTGTPPKVSSVSPADNKTGVKPSTNVKALFSKAIDKATLTSSTFTLAPVDSSSGNVGPSIEATLTLSSDGKTATLNPFGSTSTNVLDPCTWYEATVTTGVKDKAGNSLDQDLNTTGYQPKTWRFKTSDC